MEVACCDADHEGEWEGEWEECEVVADHGETCDVRIVEDGEVCCGVPRRLVRAMQAGAEAGAEAEVEAEAKAEAAEAREVIELDSDEEEAVPRAAGAVVGAKRRRGGDATEARPRRRPAATGAAGTAGTTGAADATGAAGAAGAAERGGSWRDAAGEELASEAWRANPNPNPNPNPNGNLYVRRTAPSIGTSWTDDMRGSFTTSTSSLGFALVTESPRDSYQGEHASRHSQSKARWRVCRPNQKTLDGQPVRHTLKTAQKYIPQPVQANGSGSQP